MYHEMSEWLSETFQNIERSGLRHSCMNEMSSDQRHYNKVKHNMAKRIPVGYSPISPLC